MAKTRTRTRRTRRLRRRQRGGLDWNTVNMNRYENNANYRRSIKAQNNRNYNATIAQGKAALAATGVNVSKLNLKNVPNNESVPMTEEEMEHALAELELEAATITKNGRKFISLTEEEMGALNAEDSEAFGAWITKQLGE